MANENQIKSTNTNPFVYKASSSDAIKKNKKTGSSIWLRKHDASTIAQQKDRAASASKWLDQLLDTLA